MAKKRPQLSKRAQALLARVRDPGRFYVWRPEHESAAMRELMDAGLVVRQGRVNQIVACYVPKGTKPLRMEQFPCEQKQ
jgi:hypothetical protein